MTVSNDSKAVLTLASRLGDRGRPSLAAGQWHSFAKALGDAGLVPADLFDPGSVERLVLQPEERDRIEQLLAGAASVVVELESLVARGIWVLTLADDGYPEALRRLAHRAPPVLFGVGDAALLDGGGIGVVGSREVTEDGVAVARRLASAAASHGLPVVSGGARGVDQQAMNASYEAGGSVVGVLADSLEKRIKSADVRAALDGGTTCLISQQHPASGFSPAAAMGRNKLVYALADVTVVVASGTKGGTWEGAVEALSQRIGKVAVWRGEGEGPANEALERKGAQAIGSIDDLWAHLGAEVAADPEQLEIKLG